MKTRNGLMAAALVLASTTAATFAYADTSSTTSSSTSSSTTAVATQSAKFDAAYQKNQQTEATLLPQAQQVQSSNSAQYASFVNAVATQVATLYASEQALTQVSLTLGSAINGHPEAGLVEQEKGLESRIRAAVSAAASHKGKHGRDKHAIVKLHTEVRTMQKEIQHINVLIRTAGALRAESDERSFNSNIAMLRRTILGLQADEIRVTKAWIASGQLDVTGSVYGSVYGTQSSTNSTVTLTAND